jgi:ParB-like chromosome segregation protein Spo0J
MASDSSVYGLPNLTAADFSRLSLEVFEFVPEFDISTLDERVQIRDIKHVGPAPRVNEMAARMKDEPTAPILVTRDGVTVDGNTRVKGAKKLKRKFLPAVVLDVEYKTADPKLKLRVDALAAKANRHGLALDAKEKREIVSAAVNEGWTQDIIGMFVGVTPAVITQIRDEIAGIDKLKRVGMSPNGVIKGGTLRALGKVAPDLNDAPFKAVAELAADAGFNSAEIRDLAKRAKGAGSDVGALDLIAAERTQNEGRIAEHKLTGAGKPPIPRMLRQHLGFVTKYSTSPESLIEQGIYAEQHLATLRDAQTVINAAIERQEMVVRQGALT